MRLVLVCALVAIAASWAQDAPAQMTPDQARQAAAFAAAVRALDPHTIESEPALKALVEEYVPDAGRVQVFLEFMTASGFECPPSTSPVRGYVNLFDVSCSFQPDLGPSGEPSLSSVIETALFFVTANCNKKTTSCPSREA